MHNPSLFLPAACVALSLASLLLTSRSFTERIRLAEEQGLTMAGEIRRDFRAYALRQVPLCAGLLAFFLLHTLILIII